MALPITSFDEIVWPAIPLQSASTRLAIQYQLEQSQWWTAEELLAHQLKQLSIVLTHAYKTVPFYRDFYQSQSYKPKRLLTEKLFSDIPIVSRENIQQAGDKLVSTNIPEHHGKLHDKSTSGSTGTAIKITDTEVGTFFWHAFKLREHLWHKRDFSKKLSAIRLTHSADSLPPNGIQSESWGASIVDLYHSGPATCLSIQSTIEEQWIWLKKQNPDYFLTYPSNLKALTELSIIEGNPLTNLREVITMAEIVTEDIRESVKRAWNVPVTDMYSSQEIGYIAFQCPDNTHYHVQSESVILEVLDDDNKPCKPGEVGRVVLTTLHNFASPLIRYEIGDYAEVGEPCSCGRGLPVLNRIVGRVRNLITYPDGTKARPTVWNNSYTEVCTIKQFQFIQKTVNDIEVKLVIDGSFSAEQKNKLKALILSSLRYSFNIEITLHNTIARSAGGKFEDFVSYVK